MPYFQKHGKINFLHGYLELWVFRVLSWVFGIIYIF